LKKPPSLDIDIYRSANLLIQQHGENAEWEAARLGDLAIEKGDARGERVWLDVLKAIKVLMETEPSGPIN
jgi:hypothetical protein